jgi:iron complex transport system ATP-binding protein
MSENALPTATAPLRAEAVGVRLGGRLVVDGVSFELAPGTWTAIVGPNGAGKSTLLSALAGVRATAAGRIWLHGRPLDAWSARERAQRRAWLAQQGEAEGDLSAGDVVLLGRLPHHGLFGEPTAADCEAVQQALTVCDAAALAGRRLDELSGGERQRVLLARALAVQAPLLLLDEPTAHLDAPHQRALFAALAAHTRAHAAAGGAALVVLHDLSAALAADRVLVLEAGRLVADGTPGDAALHAALERVSGGALAIVAVPQPEGPRWVAVPRR